MIAKILSFCMTNNAAAMWTSAHRCDNLFLVKAFINAQIRRIVCMFAWAVEEELIKETIHLLKIYT